MPLANCKRLRDRPIREESGTRNLIVCNIMSLDGYYEGPGRDVMVLPMDENFDAYNAERLRRDLARRPHDLRGAGELAGHRRRPRGQARPA
jgi:hypothetical protein